MQVELVAGLVVEFVHCSDLSWNLVPFMAPAASSSQGIRAMAGSNEKGRCKKERQHGRPFGGDPMRQRLSCFLLSPGMHASRRNWHRADRLRRLPGFIRPVLPPLLIRVLVGWCVCSLAKSHRNEVLPNLARLRLRYKPQCGRLFGSRSVWDGLKRGQKKQSPPAVQAAASLELELSTASAGQYVRCGGLRYSPTAADIRGRWRCRRGPRDGTRHPGAGRPAG